MITASTLISFNRRVPALMLAKGAFFRCARRRSNNLQAELEKIDSVEIQHAVLWRLTILFNSKNWSLSEQFMSFNSQPRCA